MRKKILIIVSLLIITSLLAGCNLFDKLQDMQSQQYSIQVKAVDSITNKLVSSADIITASGNEGSDTGGGTTSFILQSGKEYTFKVSAPYYKNVQKTVKINKSSSVITIKLDKMTGTVRGEVTSNKNNGISANITLTEDGVNLFSITSKDDGIFNISEIPIHKAMYNLKITHPKYKDRTLSDIPLSITNTNIDLGEISLTENSGTYAGKIVDSIGEPVNNVSVTLVEAGKKTESNYQGGFEINVLPGTYAAVIEHPNYKKIEKNITVKSNEKTFDNLQINAKPGAVSGIIMDEYGVPINDVKVSLVENSLQTQTLSNGHFNFDGIEPGNYTLELIHPQFKIHNEKVIISKNETTNLGNIVLYEKTGMMTGRVLSEDGSGGTPLANANVKLVLTGENINTDGNGYYTFNNIRTGNYTLKFTALNHGSKQLKDIEVKENSITNIPSITLIKDPAEILGTIVDPTTNDALKDVKVTLNELEISQNSNFNGNFKFKNLLSNTYSLTLSLPNYYSKNITDIYCGSGSISNIGTVPLLPKPARITGITTPGAEVTNQKTSNKVTVDNSGSFTFDNLEPNNIYTISIIKNNYEGTNIKVSTTPGQTYDLGDVSLEPIPGEITGSSNAGTITIVETGQVLDNTASTFKFSSLEPGDYTLEFTKTDYQTKQINITVNPNQTTDTGTITLDPKPTTIKGYTDHDTTVTIVETGSTMTTSATSGYFEFTGLAPNTYNIEFSKTNYYTKTITKQVNPNQVLDIGTITLDPKPGKITGTTNADTVYIQETNQNAYINSGNFTINDVQPGSYTVVFEKTNYQSKTINTIDINPNQTNNLGDINLNPLPGKITGTIQDYFTGNVLSNVSVSLNELEKSVTTNANGVFELTDIPDGGPYSVTISYPNYTNQDKINININPKETINFGIVKLVPKPATLTGTGTQGSEVTVRENTSLTTNINSTNSFTITDIEPGKSYTVDITKTNYYSETRTFTANPGQTHNLGDVSLTPEPMRIIGSTEASSIYIVELDKTINHPGGAFDIEINEPRDYTLRFNKTNYYTKTITKTINAGQTIDLGMVSLNPKPGKVYGSAPSGAIVYLYRNGTLVDSDTNGGYFEFISLPSEEVYDIVVTKDNYYDYTDSSMLNASGEINFGTISMQIKEGSISGTTNADYVTIIDGPQIPSTDTKVVSSNIFNFNNLIPGDYTLQYSKNNYYTDTKVITVNPDLNTDAGVFDLQPKEATIKGTSGTGTKAVLVNTGIEDSGGTFSFTNLTPFKTYTIAFIREGYTPIVEEVYVGANETVDLGSNTPSASYPSLGTIQNKVIDYGHLGQWGDKQIKTSGFHIDYQQTVEYYLFVNGHEYGSQDQTSYTQIRDANGNSIVGISEYGHDTSNIGIDQALPSEWGTYLEKHGATVEEEGSGKSYFENGKQTWDSTQLNRGTHNIYIQHDWGEDALGIAVIKYKSDMKSPNTINFDKKYGKPSSSQIINISASDEHSGVSKIQYVFTKDTSEPLASDYTDTINDISGNAAISSAGTWYLHVKAIDKEGNYTWRVAGPYIVK